MCVYIYIYIYTSRLYTFRERMMRRRAAHGGLRLGTGRPLKTVIIFTIYIYMYYIYIYIYIYLVIMNTTMNLTRYAKGGRLLRGAGAAARPRTPLGFRV